ncbi:MAG TPA: hypothetical protein VF773_04145 [Verrucomicrobiae bacterium]
MPQKAPSKEKQKRVVHFSTRKKLLFGLVAAVIGFVVLELILAVVGVKPMRFESDPNAAFSSNSRHFVEVQGADGETLMKTAKDRLDFFNAQTFPKKKAPGTFRIFSMGGSTTYGHPYTDATSFNGWLREFLAATAPERKWEAINAGGISYGSTRVAFLMEELAQYEPDLFVVYCGQNEFLEKRIHRKITQHSPVVRAWGNAARRTRSGHLLKKAADSLTQRTPAPNEQALLPDEPQTLLDQAVGPTAYTRAGLEREQVFAQYRINMERIIEIARSASAKVVVVVPASNLRDFAPFKSEFREGLSDDLQARCRSLLTQAREDFMASPAPENGLMLANEAAAIDPLYAETHYVRGRLLEKLGRFAEAKTAFERARDEDVCPLRAPAKIRQTLLDLCAAKSVPVIDFHAMVEKQSEHGIPGSKLFLDHVHPTITGYRTLALEILQTIEREKIAPITIQAAAIERATATVSSRVDNGANAFALMNLCKTLGWAGKREEAFIAGQKAAELAPDNLRVRHEAGLAAILARRPAEAVEHFRKIVLLEPSNAEAHNGLGLAFERMEKWPEAVEHYRLSLQFGSAATRVRDNYNLTNAQHKLANSAPRAAP